MNPRRRRISRTRRTSRAIPLVGAFTCALCRRGGTHNPGCRAGIVTARAVSARAAAFAEYDRLAAIRSEMVTDLAVDCSFHALQREAESLTKNGAP